MRIACGALDFGDACNVRERNFQTRWNNGWLPGGPTPYLQGVKEMVWELSVVGDCTWLREDNLRSATTFTLNASGLRFVNWGELLKMGDTPNVRNRLNQPTLRLGVRALAVGSACFVDIDAHVEVAIEGGHFIFNKQPLGPGAGMNIWHDAGEMISAPSNEIEGRASQVLDRIIKPLANAWVASQPR